VATAFSYYTKIRISHDARELDVAKMGNPAFCNTNISSSLCVVYNGRIDAAPILYDRVLHRGEASLEGTKNMSIGGNGATSSDQLVRIHFSARNCSTSNVTKNTYRTRQ